MNYGVGTAITRQQAQKLAVAEARKGAGFVSPNPLVGCVIVDESHQFLASGYHAKVGEAHAEVNAFNKVSTTQLQGATVYLTLEPCAHYGRTPPCVDRLLSEPLKKVVVGLKDPNPLVAGKSIKRLQDKGIEVEMGPEFSKDCQYLAEIFLWHIQNKLPFVALKLATSMDGKLALSTGESQWITSDEARIYARTLRAEYDATFIGARTLIHDNPSLDFRGTRFEGLKTNRVVIWDPTGKTKDFLPNSNLMKTVGRENIIILNDPQLNPDSLKNLYNQGITSLFVEGGGHTISQFIENKLFNKIYQFVAPCLMGHGLGWTDTLNLNTMSERIPLEFEQFENIGHEILIKAYLKKRDPIK